jgi:hypothetical protein
MKKILVKTALVCVCVLAFAFSFNAQTDEKGRPIVRPPIRSNFGVEVLVNGYPLENLYGRGRRFVEAIEGAEYELRIRNPLGIRVAVALFVDGLNTIDARRTSAEKATKWVIEPYGTLTISGWQVSDSRARRFYFTTESDSYAARIGQPADFGNITAVFFREKQRYVVKPQPRIYKDDNISTESKRKESAPNESSSKAGAADSTACCPPRDDKAATGIGRDVNHNVEWIDMKLEERSTATVTIRYEYRNALIRLGVIPSNNSKGVVKPRERVNDARYAPEPK